MRDATRSKKQEEREEKVADGGVALGLGMKRSGLSLRAPLGEHLALRRLPARRWQRCRKIASSPAG